MGLMILKILSEPALPQSPDVLLAVLDVRHLGWDVWGDQLLSDLNVQHL